MKNNRQFDIYQIETLKAINNVLSRDGVYFYRKICRWFSKEFSTPLVEVYKYPYEFILQHYYEAELDRLDYNSVYDLAAQTYIPELADKYEEENRKYAEELEKEQKRTLDRKKRKNKSQSLGNSPNEMSGIPKIKPVHLKFDGNDSE